MPGRSAAKGAAPVSISLGCSLWQRRVVLLVHLLAITTWLAVFPAWYWRLGVVALLALSALIVWRRLHWPWRAIRIFPGGAFALVAPDTSGGAGGTETAEPKYQLSRGIDSAWALWIGWRDDDGVERMLMLWRDQFDADGWRRLRSWVRANKNAIPQDGVSETTQ